LSLDAGILTEIMFPQNILSTSEQSPLPTVFFLNQSTHVRTFNSVSSLKPGGFSNNTKLYLSANSQYKGEANNNL
jgi:hypothetical protein